MAIDRDKLRDAMRRLNSRLVHDMLEDAVALLPPSKLAKLAGRYLDVAALQVSSPKVAASLLTQVKAFEKASLAGDYFESFAVNSKNCSEMSGGTRAWIADCLLLLARCVAEARKDSLIETRSAFDAIFSLLHRLDEDPDDVIFFADEAGSWQVGVDWKTVLPAWCMCLSATADPDESARQVVAVMDRFVRHDRDKLLSAAARRASAPQRAALFEASARARSDRRGGDCERVSAL